MDSIVTLEKKHQVSATYAIVLAIVATLTILLKINVEELKVAGVFLSCILVYVLAQYEYLAFKGKIKSLSGFDVFLLYAAPTIFFFILINAYNSHLENSIEAIGELLEVVIFVLAACVGVLIFFGIPILLVLSPFLLTAYSWQSLQSSRVRSVLHQKGFIWISLKEAKVFHKEAGINLANQLPPFEHLGTIPDYSTGDITSMVKIAKLLPRRFKS